MWYMVQYSHNIMGQTQTPSWMITFKTQLMKQSFHLANEKR